MGNHRKRPVRKRDKHRDQSFSIHVRLLLSLFSSREENNHQATSPSPIFVLVLQRTTPFLRIQLYHLKIIMRHPRQSLKHEYPNLFASFCSPSPSPLPSFFNLFCGSCRWFTFKWTSRITLNVLLAHVQLVNMRRTQATCKYTWEWFLIVNKNEIK